MIQPIPDKIQQLRGRYASEEHRPWSMGYFGRLLPWLEEINLADLLTGDPRVLVVGPSTDSVKLRPQCYDVVELVAYLQGNSLSYRRLDIVDKNAEALAHFPQQKDLSLCGWDHRYRGKMLEDAVLRYNAYAGHLGLMTRKFAFGAEYFWLPLPTALTENPIRPACFTEDIVTFPLPADTYDLVLCRHVLYQTGKAGTRAALWNISQAMTHQGVLLVGEGYGMPGAIIPDIYPQLSRKQQRRLNLYYVPGTDDMILQKGSSTSPYERNRPLDVFLRRDG